MSATVKNQQRLLRKLQRIAKATENEVAPAIDRSATAIQMDAILRVRKDTSELASFIEKKIGNGGLTAIVGPGAKSVAVIKTQRGGSPFATRKAGAKSLGAITKVKLFQFFKGYWLEFGTKGYVVETKNAKVLSDGKNFYGTKVNIPARPKRPFMQPAYDVNERWAINEVTKAVNEMIRKAGRL